MESVIAEVRFEGLRRPCCGATEKGENIHEAKEKKWKQTFKFCFRYYLGKKLCGADGS